MPPASTIYLIGVIREWEKKFLESDEYTRLTEASSYDEALQVLTETPYGSVEGLDRHLLEVHDWLVDSLDDERVLRFLGARYDALNVASCLLQHRQELDAPENLSPLGTIRPNALRSAIWRDLDWERLPQAWMELVRKLLAADSATQVLREVETLYLEELERLAFTPLMKALAQLARERHENDAQERPFKVSEAKTTLAASTRDRIWDERITKLIREHRLGVEGVDPIIAFWMAKEIEVRSIRLLLAGKVIGLPRDEVRALRRPAYLGMAVSA